ncbi:MAG: hypothetical protein Q7S53_04250 [bacterium]|nr:hypothetical protein [bacterium]
MKFKVEYSIEKDMVPYLNAVWKMQYKTFGRNNLRERLLSSKPEQFQKDIKKAKTEEEAKIVINDFLYENLEKNKAEFAQKIKKIQKNLDDNKEKIIGKLEKLYNKEFPFNVITIYLTTAGICPYNYEKRWFMTYANADEARVLSVASHELNHFMFFYYYLPSLKKEGIDDHKLMVLKEALVVLDPNDTDKKPQAEDLKKFLKTLSDRPMDEIIELAIKSEAFKNIPVE